MLASSGDGAAPDMDGEELAPTESCNEQGSPEQQGSTCSTQNTNTAMDSEEANWEDSMDKMEETINERQRAEARSVAKTGKIQVPPEKQTSCVQLSPPHGAGPA